MCECEREILSEAVAGDNFFLSSAEIYTFELRSPFQDLVKSTIEQMQSLSLLLSSNDREEKKTFQLLQTLLTNQCDQITRLFACLWPFTAMNMCPVAYKNYPKSSKHFAKYLMNPFKWPKFFNGVSKWQNIPKSGHTVTKAHPSMFQALTNTHSYACT